MKTNSIIAHSFTFNENNFSIWSPKSSVPYSPPPPTDNTTYLKQSYWNDRFKQEEEYEWLVDYKKIRDQIRKVLLGSEDGSGEEDKEKLKQKILLIGCGNSSMGHDMWVDGFTDVESMDYAESVIVALKEKYRKMYEN